MNKVLILTDSTADIPKELVIKHDIQTIPLFIRFEEEVFLDGEDMTPELLYRKVKASGIMARSSGLRSTDFNVAFRKYLARGYDIIYIGVSSHLSGSLQSAEIAKNSINPDRIHIVDSLNLSAGLSLLVFKAVEMRNQGLSAYNIKLHLEKLVPLVRSYYVIPALDYLYASGKITAGQRTLGKLLGLKPILTVLDGHVVVYKKPFFGNMEKHIDHLIKTYLSLGDQVDKTHVVITQSIAPKSFNYLKESLKKKVSIEHLIESEMGCVMSAHTGKETLGFAYLIHT